MIELLTGLFLIRCGTMKGYYVAKSKPVRSKHARIYKCDHPLYSRCTLYFNGEMGLAVIQMRFSPKEKVAWWGPVDPWLIEDIYENEGFSELFMKEADTSDENGLYPTIKVRKLMHALGMKPMKKSDWEKEF